jgi:hypothetical protein
LMQDVKDVWWCVRLFIENLFQQPVEVDELSQ